VTQAAETQEAIHAAATGQTVPHAPAALYGTLLAAYKQMVDSYQPQYVNDIIVLTAGMENDPSDMRGQPSLFCTFLSSLVCCRLRSVFTAGLNRKRRTSMQY